MRPLNVASIHQIPANKQLSVIRLLQAAEGGWHMEEEGLTDDDLLSRKMLSETLKTVRRTSWRRYLQIMLLASFDGGITMNEVATKLQEKPQSIHPLLKRLIERGALTREKRGSEFYYHLASDIKKEDLEAQLSAIADEDLTDPEPVWGSDADESLKHDQPEKDKPEEVQVKTVSRQDNSSKSDREEDLSQLVDPRQTIEWQKEIIQMRMSKLPEFNPEWTPEVQKAWFDALTRISSINDL